MGKMHNSKHYFKRLSKKRVLSLQKIGDVFRKINKGTTDLCVIQSEVRKVMNELLTSVCNETTDNHDNSLSKAEELSSTPETVTPSGVINNVAATTKQVDQRKFSSQKYEHSTEA